MRGAAASLGIFLLRLLQRIKSSFGWRVDESGGGNFFYAILTVTLRVGESFYSLWLRLRVFPFSSFAFQRGRMTKKAGLFGPQPKVDRFAVNLGLNDGTPLGF